MKEVTQKGITYLVENEIITAIKSPVRIELACQAINNIGKNINNI